MSEPTRSASDFGSTAAPGDVATLDPNTPVAKNSTATSPPGYDLLGEVGRGGMGVVYRARDVALSREVAVKILQDRYAPESGTAKRFVEEARITAQLQHPGIPAVYQVGSLRDGRPFLAMKLIKGDTLADLLKANAPVDVLAVFEAAAQAVGYAHAHGVIHRDLKPANVMVGAFGEVQVMDWGLAKLLANPDRKGGGGSDADPDLTAAHTEIKSARDSDTPYTQYGSVLGTPAFMAPEQAGGEIDKIGTRSDVFGLGAILCVLLTGQPPFEGKDAESVRLNAIRGKTEEAFARLDASGADPDVVALCKRCLSFEPDDRPASANEVANEVAALRRAADDRAKQAERDKLAAEVREGEQRKRRRAVQWAAGAVSAVLLLGVIGTGVGLVLADQARREADKARSEETAARGVAEQKTKDAEAARVEAERTADDALAVRSLLVDILKQGSTAGRAEAGSRGGAGLTVKQAIDYTARTVGERFKARPRVEGEVRDTLGTMYFNLGAFPEAADQLAKAVAVRERHLGPDAVDTLKSLNNLAVVYRAQKRNADAERILTDVLAAKRRVLGEKDRSTLTTVNNLGNLYHEQKNYVRAEEYWEAAYIGRRQALGDDDPDTEISVHNVALVRFSLKRYEDALPLFQAAADAFTKRTTRNSPRTLQVVKNLGMCHHRLGHREEAEALYLEVVTRAAGFEPTERRVLLPEVAGELVSLYQQWGRPADAAAWREKLKDYLPETLPPPRPAKD